MTACGRLHAELTLVLASQAMLHPCNKLQPLVRFTGTVCGQCVHLYNEAWSISLVALLWHINADLLLVKQTCMG